jgi:hypothetical protein
MVVFEAHYRPSGYSRPSGAIIAGERYLRLKDPTPDGGANIPTSPGDSGRPVLPGSVAKVVQFPANRKIQDLEALFQYTVSERLKDLIEEIEPEVHQFVKVKFVSKSSKVLENRWFWQICNRIDSIYGSRSGWHMDRGIWLHPASSPPIFDNTKIGSAQFWREKHYNTGMMLSEEAVARFNENDISGFQIKPYETRSEDA